MWRCSGQSWLHSFATISTRALGFSKGHVEDSDMDRKETAARELAEETGIDDIEFVDGLSTELPMILGTRAKESTSKSTGISQKLKLCK